MPMSFLMGIFYMYLEGEFGESTYCQCHIKIFTPVYLDSDKPLFFLLLNLMLSLWD